MKIKRYTDEFKISMVEEFLRNPGQAQKQFANSRGFSDASIRQWLQSPQYNNRITDISVRTKPKPLRAKNVSTPTGDYDELYPPAQAKAEQGAVYPLTSNTIIVNLLRHILKFQPNVDLGTLLRGE